MRFLALLLLAGCGPQSDPFEHVPLTAAHEAAACSGCHGAVWGGPVAEHCEDCHVAPEGHTNGRCDRCHDGVVWDGAAFDHWLPLPHQGEVAACDACHVGGRHTKVDCLGCHAHRHESVSPPHMALGVPGYTYETEACLRCHPDGQLH